MTGDIELLRRYAEDRDEAAFAALVAARVSFVYAAALRQLGGAVHRAEDVTQTVFIQLARNAPKVAQRDDLVGWLYTATHHAAANLKRTEARRQRREEEAHTMQDTFSDPAGDVSWEQLRPVLDEAMLELGEIDRRALLLRFFEQARFAELGRKLGLTEGAARMRVERALDKLRALLAQRGIASTSAALAAAFTGQSTVAAPAGLAAAVTGAALAGASGGVAVATTGILLSAKSVVAAALVIGAIGLATYKFGVFSGPVPGQTAADRMAGVERSAQTTPPESGAKPASAAAVAPAPAPTTEPARSGSAGVAAGKMTAGDPSARNLTPQIVLGEVLSPDNSYHDGVFGVSARFPEDWTVRRAYRWGDSLQKNSVFFNTGMSIMPSMYYERYQPGDAVARTSSVDAYFRDLAVRKEISRAEVTPDYRNVPESFEFGEINGVPTMSYFATFTQGDKVMTEYFIRLAGPQSYVMIFTTGELEHVRRAMPKLQQMAKSVRIR